jgi:hypothetical protein
LKHIVKFLYDRSNESPDLWINDNISPIGEKVTFLPWEWGQPNGFPRQNCTSASKLPNITYWDSDCINSKYCFACQFVGEVVFNLRGKCAISPTIDTSYILRIDLIDDGEYILQGFSGMKKAFVIFQKIIKTTSTS